MSVYELAKQYYPRFWDEVRLQRLVDAGRLTETEYNDLVDRLNPKGEEKDEP